MKTKRLYALCYLAILLTFSSCECALRVQARADGSQDFALSLNLGHLVLEAAESVAQLNLQGGRLFDTTAIKAQLERSRFKDVATTSPAPGKLTVAATGSLSSLISQTATSLSLKLSPRSVAQTLALFPEEERAVFDLLMAPVITGEAMSAAEYRELLELVYGKPFADEAGKAAVDFLLVSPQGKAKRFTLPLLDFLTLSDERVFSIDF